MAIRNRYTGLIDKYRDRLPVAPTPASSAWAKATRR